MAKCTLLKIHCYLSDEGDKDEIFLKHNGKKIWPSNSRYKKADKDELDIQIELSAEDGQQLVLELWDYDLFSSNDRLGEFQFQLLTKGGPYRTDLKRAKDTQARYTLEWEYH
ncbi:MAG TPA: hypothetical protein PKC24_12215 [Cyclobacteriaceae bacterium]|nr:hypothetical protein [Cyclobacteriaceae bacterium]